MMCQLTRLTSAAFWGTQVALFTTPSNCAHFDDDEDDEAAQVARTSRLRAPVNSL